MVLLIMIILRYKRPEMSQADDGKFRHTLIQETIFCIRIINSKYCILYYKYFLL